VLEVNPRPPASFPLHETDDGLIAAHVAACLDGRLPPAWAPVGGAVRGLEIVYARRPFVLSARTAEQLARAGCHDRPLAGSRFGPGDPVCSVSAAGPDADAVEARLDAACDELLSILETPA
jgi:predicted ATP-grasp superfamily ATP-dependent carboligase